MHDAAETQEENDKMERQIDLNEISDGKLYGANDLVKADCGGCSGCSSCCRGMGDSILLDPLDFMRLSSASKTDAASLLSDRVNLRAVDGLILPSLKMDPDTDACTWLDENGRCTIHGSRPGFCRLFPLGRVYHDRTFSYFLQIHECRKENRMKIKVKKWLDVPDIRTYEQYIADWHYFLKDLDGALKEEETGMDSESAQKLRRQVSMAVLTKFYLTPYQGEETFYQEFYERLSGLKKLFLPVS